MKRTFQSGSQKRKKQKRMEEHKSSLPKISSFCQQLPSVNRSSGTVETRDHDQPDGPHDDESQAVGPVGDSGETAVVLSLLKTGNSVEECQKELLVIGDDNDRQCHYEAVSNVANASCFFETDNLTMLSNDPGTWPPVINNTQRIHLVKHGPLQIMKYPFPTNNESRRFTKSNYYINMKNGEKVLRTWLVYSIANDSVFCFCCALLGKGNSALSVSGFNAWQYLSRTLREHEQSKSHFDSMMKWDELKMRIEMGTTIDDQHLQMSLVDQNYWKSILQRLLAITQFLSERKMAFRGTVEELGNPANGNFLGLLELLGEFDPIAKEHLGKIERREGFSHVSWLTQNELISTISKRTIEVIIGKVKESKYFATIMDCTPDTSHQEQLSVCIRHVECARRVGVQIKERFTGFLNVHETSGEKLLEEFLSHLTGTLGLSVEGIRAQCYDNGANMRGKSCGVQARLLRLNEKALFTPCASHSINLLICDAAKSSVVSISFFGTLQRLYTIFASSVHRWEILKQHLKDFTLKPLSDTRWECRIESTKAARFQTQDLHEALIHLRDYAVNHKDSVTASEAESLANEVASWKFLLCLVAWHEVLYHINRASKLFQSPSIGLDTLQREMKTVEVFLQRFRDSGFENAEADAKEIAEAMEVPMIFPAARVQRKKRQFDYEHFDEAVPVGRDLLKQQFFLVLADVAMVSLKERFSLLQDHCRLFGFLYGISAMKNHLQNGTLSKCCEDFALKMGDVDENDLVREIKCFIEANPGEEQQDVSGSAVSMLDAIYKKDLVDLYPNLSIALRLVLTMPVTVASGERSFSTLKLIKNYLRSTMSQERLSGLAIIAIENDISRKLDYSQLINDFMTLKNRRINV